MPRKKKVPYPLPESIKAMDALYGRPETDAIFGAPRYGWGCIYIDRISEIVFFHEPGAHAFRGTWSDQWITGIQFSGENLTVGPSMAAVREVIGKEVPSGAV